IGEQARGLLLVARDLVRIVLEALFQDGLGLARQALRHGWVGLFAVPPASRIMFMPSASRSTFSSSLSLLLDWSSVPMRFCQYSCFGYLATSFSTSWLTQSLSFSCR